MKSSNAWNLILKHYDIRFSSQSEEELEEIFTYIAHNGSKNSAKSFLDQLYEKIGSLDTMPFRCRKSFYHDDENIRDMIYKGYTIVFEIKENEIIILSVFRQRAF